MENNNFKVAVFKRMPLWTGIFIHPLWKILSRSDSVSEFHLFLHQNRTLSSDLSFVVSHLYTFDKILFSFFRKFVKVKISFYENMSSPEIGQIIDEEKYDIIIPDGFTIIKKDLIDKTRLGVLLFHYGLLPEYRGMNTLEWAAILGFTQGTTLFFYDEGMDTGDILLKAELPHTIQSLAEARKKAAKESWKLMQKFFNDPDGIMENRISQTWDEGITYFKLCPLLRHYSEFKSSGRQEDINNTLTLFENFNSTFFKQHNEMETMNISDDNCSLGFILEELRVPRQERAASEENKMISALHYLNKRKNIKETIPIQLGKIIGNFIKNNSLEDLSEKTRLRLINEILLLGKSTDNNKTEPFKNNKHIKTLFNLTLNSFKKERK